MGSYAARQYASRITGEPVSAEKYFANYVSNNKPKPKTNNVKVHVVPVVPIEHIKKQTKGPAQFRW